MQSDVGGSRDAHEAVHCGKPGEGKRHAFFPDPIPEPRFTFDIFV